MLNCALDLVVWHKHYFFFAIGNHLAVLFKWFLDKVANEHFKVASLLIELNSAANFGAPTLFHEMM